MLSFIGKLLAGTFVQSEIKKIKEHLDGAVQQVEAMRAMKQELYAMADRMMAEGQVMSKDKLDSWWVEKRAQLKVWAGQ